MGSLARSADSLELELVHVDFERIDFTARLGETERTVSVSVGSGTCWRRAILFPHPMTYEGSSLGDDDLDEQVRARAAEELIRLAAALDAMKGRRRFAA